MGAAVCGGVRRCAAVCGGVRRCAAVCAFWVALAKLAVRSNSLAGGVVECLPTAQPGSASSSSKE